MNPDPQQDGDTAPAQQHDEPAQQHDEPAQQHDGPAQQHAAPVQRHDAPAAWQGLGLRLRHIGMAVPALAPTRDLLQQLLGYRLVSGPFHDPLQRVDVSFLAASPTDPAEIELIAPTSEDSPVRSLLAKGGASAYHLCFETTDLDGALAHARKLGCVILSGPVPAVAFAGRRICWLYTPTRQLFELVEAAKQSDLQESFQADAPV